jgi:hypothetical protein
MAHHTSPECFSSSLDPCLASVSPHSVHPLLPLVLPGHVIGGSNAMANINLAMMDLILVSEER